MSIKNVQEEKKTVNNKNVVFESAKSKILRAKNQFFSIPKIQEVNFW